MHRVGTRFCLPELQLGDVLVKLGANDREPMNFLVDIAGIVDIIPDFRKGQPQILQVANQPDMNDVIHRIIAETALVVSDSRGNQAVIFVIYENPAGNPKSLGYFTHLEKALRIFCHIIISQNIS